MVVDDSAVTRGLTKRWLNEDPDIDVVATCANGAIAVKKVNEAQCDVAILDIEMPEMDGLTALPLMVKADPHLKVIMASTLTHRNADISMRALSLGASDYVAKPDTSQGLVSKEDYRRGLIGKVKALGDVSREIIEQTQTPVRKNAPVPTRPVKKVVLAKTNPAMPRAIIVGCSTGGPQALDVLTAALPRDLTVPVFITQHMPPMFTTILAEQITKSSGHLCTEGKDGEIAKPGQIYLAPGDFHMTMERQGTNTVIHLDQEPPVNYCRPAADPMFASAAKVYGRDAIGVVLTGMGHDAREGARTMVDSGANVIVQDEATSVVWGMPAAVAEAGLACAVLPLKDMGRKIEMLLRGGGR